MPVTARLSKRFYDRFGDDIVNELVEWFNQVDATYRADLRELNEMNFARFDAKFEQRLAQFEAKVEQRLAQFEAKVEQRLAEVEVKLEQRLAQFEVKLEQRLTKFEVGIERSMASLETRLERRLGEQTRWYFLAWAAQLAAVIGLWFR